MALSQDSIVVSAQEIFQEDSLPAKENLSETDTSYTSVIPGEVPDGSSLRQPPDFTFSIILSCLFVLFLAIALRFRNNIKYAGILFKNLVETRTRQNFFDNTVRETSFIILLNLMWCGCAAVILYCLSGIFGIQGPGLRDSGLRFLACITATLAYFLFMSGAYMTIGTVFADSDKAKMWLKGFAASQGLMTPFFFIIALLAICYPVDGTGVLWSTVIVFTAVKLVFIWKGYRIFFSEISSWVLFLCYLCSLEIVPLILTYRLANLLSVTFLK